MSSNGPGNKTQPIVFRDPKKEVQPNYPRSNSPLAQAVFKGVESLSDLDLKESPDEADFVVGSPYQPKNFKKNNY